MTVTVTDEGTVSESADQPPAPTDRPSDGDTSTLVAEELLVEDVSIDGMCGVY